MPSFYTNPHIFILVSPDGYILWNYKTHEQYLIDHPYVKRIQEHADPNHSNTPHTSPIDDELEAANIISKTPFQSEPWDWDIISKIFHVGTQNVPSLDCSKIAAEWLKARCAENEKAVEKFSGLYVKKAGDRIALPPPDFTRLKTSTLLHTLKERKTCREFFEDSIGLEEIATVLFTVYGRFHGTCPELEELGLQELCLRKTSPSGGGLHPTEAYLIALNVDGLTPGVYHYDVQDHVLVLINKDLTEDHLIEILQQQFYMKNLAAGIFLTSCFHKVWHKYPNSRAYRVALMDVGHLSQTTQLVATALNIQTWISAAFNDAMATQLLRLTSLDEAPIFFIGLGHGSGQMLPASIKNDLKHTP